MTPVTLYDDILVDGVSMSTGLPAEVAAGANIEGPALWPYLSADQRGEFPVYQGFDGAGYTDQPYAAMVLPIYLTLSAPACEDDVPVEQSDETWAWLNNAMQEVRLLCKPDREVTLTRRRSMPDAGDDAQTARGKLLRITPARPKADTLRLVIEFTQLDAVWYGEDVEVEVEVDASTVINIEGQTRTYRIQILVPAATSGFVVANTTNGYQVALGGPETPTGGVLIDVEARTATAVVGGADWSRYLVWTKAHPMRLDPGANTIVTALTTGTSGGDTTITYAPAYL